MILLTVEVVVVGGGAVVVGGGCVVAKMICEFKNLDE